jgi:hypothetical protein
MNCAELARAAGVSERSIKALRNGHSSRQQRCAQRLQE